MAVSHPDQSLEHYPASLLAFLAENDLDTAPFARRLQLPRYVRLSVRGVTARLTPQLLQLQLGPGVHVAGVEGTGSGSGPEAFWKVTPGDTKIVGCDAWVHLAADTLYEE